MANRINGSTAVEEPRVSERHSFNGETMLSKVRQLMREGNARRIVIKNEEGRTILQAPLTVGVVGAAFAPMWMAVGAVAALVTSCSIEVEHEP